MIAKLCTWAPTATAAIEAMAGALDEFEVEGIGHNLPFLSAVMAQERFREGRLDHRLHRRGIPGRLYRREPCRATDLDASCRARLRAPPIALDTRTLHRHAARHAAPC